MFIIWGKKLVYRGMGFVADFCPLCRELKCFQLKRVGIANHLYYVTSGQGELVGHERTCTDCQTVLNADPSIYAALAKVPAAVPELIQQTFPNIEAVRGDRLALEDKLRNSPHLLSPEQRRALIKVPFLVLSPKVERRFAATHVDKEVGITIIAALALLTISPQIGEFVAPDVDTLIVILFFLLFGAVVVVWQFFASGGRFIKREVLPLLSSALRPLAPTDAELAGVISELKPLGHKIARKLKVAHLKLALAQ